MRNDKQKGFTLVELAIVLVIIGLIVSSILVGQDMIRSAELRSTVSQYRNIQTGVAAFKNKYSYIPGDITGENYGFTGSAAFQDNTVVCTAPIANGTGAGDQNGIIESSCGGNATFTGEMVTFWNHLTTPGKELIAGSFDGINSNVSAVNRGVGVTLPAMKFGGSGWGAYGADGDNFIVMGVSYDETDFADGTIQRDYPLTAVDAHNIDEKIDDGFPNDGFVRAGDKADSANTSGDINVDTHTVVGQCMADTDQSSEYAFSQTDPGCVLQFVLNTFN